MKPNNKKPVFKLSVLSIALLLIVLFLTYTSEDVHWGGGFWEQWLINHIHFSPIAAHQIVFWFRKTMHFLGYGALGILFWYYFYLWGVTRCFWFGIGATALVAVYDEFSQSFTTFRSGKPEDVLLDVCGALTIGLLARLILKWRRT